MTHIERFFLTMHQRAVGETMNSHHWNVPVVILYTYDISPNDVCMELGMRTVLVTMDI